MIRHALRTLAIQLSLLNHQVSTRVKLKDADLDCLDLITRHGPISPTALARRSGLHPATLTGILDRLEKGGWVAREADQADRRAIRIRALPSRSGDLLGLYAGMNVAVRDICSDYSDDELRLIADFLTRVSEAGQTAASDLASRRQGP